MTLTDRERRILNYAILHLLANLDDDDVADINARPVPAKQIDCERAHRNLADEIYVLNRKVNKGCQ